MCSKRVSQTNVSYLDKSLVRLVASNQFALPVLGYLMWTQQWPVMELKQIDREARKIVFERG